MKVQRYKCMNDQCIYDWQEQIPFATGSCSYTHRLARYVIDLLKTMTQKDVSNLLDVLWNTIKDIHVRYLERHYSPPSLDGVDCIGIDKFAVRKNIYKTIAVDLRTSRILYVGDGKGADSMDRFWKKSGRRALKSDMSPPICLRISSHPYLKTVLKRYMYSIISM